MALRHAWMAYVGAILGAELLLLVAPAGTALIDASVLVLCLSQFGWAQRSPLAIGDPTVRVLPAIALPALLRLLSMTMPVPELPRTAWLILAGAPLLLAVLAAGRLATMDVRELSLARISTDWRSLAIAASGIPIGLALAAVAPNDPALAIDTPIAAAAAGFALAACAALPEELIFRGVLQPLLREVSGRFGVPVTAVMFAATYVGTRSPQVIGIMLLVGLVYGWEVQRTRSLWSPIAGHVLLVLSATMLSPLLQGS
jgi:membrane protease YdiL (CAAX protease family)